MNPLKQKLDINNERYRIIVSIKEDYLDGKLSLEEGNRILKEKLGTCTPDEFAYAEQSLKGVYKDEEILEKMDDLLELFDGVLVRAENEYPENHPLWAYLEEINAVEKVALEADGLLKQEKFIKNPWLGVFDSLAEWRTHLSRKQNQLYPMLEDHGFDRPTRIMWTFDDAVRDAISASYALLREDKYEEFLASVPETLAKLRDLNSKELEVLLPTSYKLLSDEEFVRMSKNDHEIGYAIINAPGLYVVPGINDSAAQLNGNNSAQGGAVSNEFLNDLAGLLSKYVGPVGGAPAGKDAVLDVATGKLTLEQINLLFRHLPVDLSYVDENELVKFYSDTAHRIFPRSANVIGREVKNCHPANEFLLTLQNVGVTMDEDGRKVVLAEDVRNSNGRAIKSQFWTDNRVNYVGEPVNAIVWLMKDKTLPPILKISDPVLASTMGATLATRRSTAEKLDAHVDPNALVIEPYANPFRTYPLVRDYESYKKLFSKCGVECYIMNTGFFLENKIPKEVTLDLLERLVEGTLEFKPFCEYENLSYVEVPGFEPPFEVREYHHQLHQAFEFRYDYVEKLKGHKNELPQEVLDVLKSLM